jgi:pimeloyl-ACP methyl ester carboxylesterase
MAGFTLVHGAWHGGWAWDALRAELEARGHTVATPDLPCDDVTAGIADYARVVPPADVLVGHSLGGLTIPLVAARLRVFLTALVPGVDRTDAFVPGFGDARSRDELGRSYYPDPADGARELQYPEEAASLARRLRRQAPVDSTVPQHGPAVYIVCTEDAAIRPEWQRAAARTVGPSVELEAGHSPMLTHPRELADILESAAREAGVM